MMSPPRRDVREGKRMKKGRNEILIKNKRKRSEMAKLKLGTRPASDPLAAPERKKMSVVK